MALYPSGAVRIGGKLRGPQWDSESGQTGVQLGVEEGYATDLQRVDTNPQQLQRVGALGHELENQAFVGYKAPQVAAQQVTAGAVGNDALTQAQGQGQGLNRAGATSIAGLQAAAAGKVPSAAELQGRMQMQQAVANTMAMGASARGSSDARAAAQREAMQQGGVIQGNVIANAGVNRAAEQAQARQTLASAIQGQQAAVGNQANTAADVAKAQQSLNLQEDVANQAANVNAQTENQQAYMAGKTLQQQAAMSAAGLYSGQLASQNQLIDYNNQQAQTDFNRQMAMNNQALQQYGIDRNVALGTYQADQARQAQETASQYQMAGQTVQGIGAGFSAYFSRK